MKILGIDPGTVTTGYGVIDGSGEEVALVDYGVFTAPPRSPIEERLHFLYQKIMGLISIHQPDVVAIEQPFFGKNARSALAIGRAEAVAILAAVNKGLPVHEYTPAQIKQRVANYGASSKEQIQEAVRLQLRLAQAPTPADAADALAVAFCHLSEAHLTEILSGHTVKPSGEKR